MILLQEFTIIFLQHLFHIYLYGIIEFKVKQMF